jgi:tetratricopeptide (TPR) repeat protein
MSKLENPESSWGDDFLYYSALYSEMSSDSRIEKIKTYLASHPGSAKALRFLLATIQTRTYDLKELASYVLGRSADHYVEYCNFLLLKKHLSEFFPIWLDCLKMFPDDLRFTEMASKISIDLPQNEKEKYGQLIGFYCITQALRDDDLFRYNKAGDLAKKAAFWLDRSEGTLYAGTLYYRGAQGEGALNCFLALNEQYGTHAYFHDLVGDCHVALDKMTKAIECYQAAIHLDGKREISKEKLKFAEKRRDEKVVGAVVGVLAVAGGAGALGSGATPTFGHASGFGVDPQFRTTYYGNYFKYRGYIERLAPQEPCYGVSECQPHLQPLFTQYLELKAKFETAGAHGLIQE